MVNRNITIKENNEFDSHGLAKGDKLYYARIIPSCAIYEITEIKIRTLEPTYFVGTDKLSKQAFMFGYKSLNVTIFKNRESALNVVKEAEMNKKKYQISDERYYEED